MTPLDRFDVLTPLGPAICIGIVDDTDAVEWVTFIKSTGEPWFWKNPQIRIQFDVTSGYSLPSPFTDISDQLQRQIDRYKKNGWL